MDKNNPLDVFFYYMWNHWSYDTIVDIFGQYRGNAIANTWATIADRYGCNGAIGALYYSLKSDERLKLWNAAAAYYNKQQ